MTSSSLGPSGTFYFFAAVAAGSFFWIWAFVFETKGRSLEEIQELLKGGGKGAKVVDEEPEAVATSW